MNGPTSPRPARPMSIREITHAAEDFEFRTTIPFKYWARSADTLFQEVCSPNPSVVPRGRR